MNRSGSRVALLVGAALVLAACHPIESAPPAPRPVVALPAHADGAAVARTLPGEIQPRYATPLSFRIAGKIIERKVRLGDTVKAGQVVALLDPSDVEKMPRAHRRNSMPRRTASRSRSSSSTAIALRRTRT